MRKCEMKWRKCENVQQLKISVLSFSDAILWASERRIRQKSGVEKRSERVVAHNGNAARVVNGGGDEELPLAIDDEGATVEGHIAGKG